MLFSFPFQVAVAFGERKERLREAGIQILLRTGDRRDNVLPFLIDLTLSWRLFFSLLFWVRAPIFFFLPVWSTSRLARAGSRWEWHAILLRVA